MAKTSVTIPGKLYLAGEYAVVDGGLAIISAVDQYLQVVVEDAISGKLKSDQNLDLILSWNRKEGKIIVDQDHPYVLVTTAMQVAEEYLRALGFGTESLYSLTISSDLDHSGSGQKYGLGSSGAVTVAVIKAILTHFNHAPNPMTVYKLAVIAQTRLGLSGSFGDIAASSFGGLIVYQRVNPTWLSREIAEQSMEELVASEWQQLHIESLTLPPTLQLLVGWTKSVASTDQLLAQLTIKTQDKETIRQRFVKESQACLTKLVTAFQMGNSDDILDGIRTNRRLLLDYANQVGLRIETPALTTLISLAEQYGASAKTSGAGGGDCGFCLVTDERQAALIRKAWQEKGILPLPLRIAPLVTTEKEGML